VTAPFVCATVSLRKFSTKDDSSDKKNDNSDQVSKTLDEIENLLKSISAKQPTSAKLANSPNLSEKPSTSASTTSRPAYTRIASKEEEEDEEDDEEYDEEEDEEEYDEEGNLIPKKNPDPFALENLKYLKFYPKVVRQWVLDAKTPKGRFNRDGEWETVEEETAGDDASKLVAQTLAQKALEDDSSVKERPIPPGLENAYRFGIQPEEMEGMPDKIKDLFSFKYAKQHEINQYKIGQAVKQFGKSEGDTGSAGVQCTLCTFSLPHLCLVAAITERINYLTEHMKRHPKDKNTKYQLMILLNRRRKVMKYLKGRDVATYYKVLKAIGVRDMIL
jgi:small subunit ribosomal protein S15